MAGPANAMRVEPKIDPKSGKPVSNAEGEIEYTNVPTEAEFTVYIDPEAKAAKLEVQKHEFILKEGEWSEWIEVEFSFVPGLAKASALAKFYMQEISPDFKLYVSPLQINPANQAMPITEPKSWGKTLTTHLGYFYTQQFPEDTKALSEGIFSGQEFWRQTRIVYEERRRAMEYCLREFAKQPAPAMLFFYYSSVDQGCHMLWRYIDEEHPGYDPTQDLRYSIQTIYTEMDSCLGHAMKSVGDDTTVIAMSDHGFAPFYYGMNLNSWLAEKGYIHLKNRARQEEYKYFSNVDWSKTKAYALGLNGVYVNLQGREKNGVVPIEEYDQVLDALERDMLAARDLRNGGQPITGVVRPRRDFHGPYADKGPDILVGYNRGYRSSWESPLGEFPKEIYVDNDKAWSADHCMDYRLTPGVLLANREITMESPALYDLTAAVLTQFGVTPPKEMIGKNCLG